jgi:4-amino-4-deoxy-L-arabinose transferase-like glycosyltransferase
MTRAATAVDWLRRRLDVTQPQLLLLAAILAVATAVRVAWVAYAARLPQQYHDPLFYVFYGLQIAVGHGYRLKDGSPSAYYPIGYPATLAALFFVVKHTIIPDNFPNAVGAFQVFLGVSTVALAFYVGRRLFGTAVGLLAALWIALFPNLIFLTAAALSETLFNLLIMVTLAILVSTEWRKGEMGYGRLAAVGVLLGVATLVRPIALLFLPLLAVVWLFAGARWRRSAAQIGVVLVATVAVIIPWSIRNFVVMDAPLVISANLGDDLCMGHHPGATGHFELPDFCFAGYDQLKRPEFEVRRNDENTRKAVKFAIHHPVFELKLLPHKAWWTWNNDHDGLGAVESYGDDPFINRHLRTVLARTADNYFFITISLGGLGLIGLALSRGDPRRVFFLLATLAFAGIPLVFFGDARFHVPAMPLLSVTAAWAVVSAASAAPRLTAQMRGAAGSGVEVSESERTVAEQDAL